MLIDRIYQQLHSTRLVRNHAIFSVKFLGRGARYYDYLRCTRSEASVAALSTLAVRLTNVADQFRSTREWVSYADLLDAMAEQVWAEIEDRSYRDAWRAPQAQHVPGVLTQGR